MQESSKSFDAPTDLQFCGAAFSRQLKAAKRNGAD
jgi:hypothetical protein